MTYYRTIRKYERKLQPHQRNLQTLLDKNFREECKIDEILFCVFNIISLRTTLCRKFQCLNKGSSLPDFLGFQSFENITAGEISKNYLCREKALFAIVQREGQDFYHFFRHCTLKNYGFLVESIIVDISPYPSRISREKKLRNILNEIFLSHVYCEFVRRRISLYNDKFCLGTDEKIKKKINALFKRENQLQLKNILFFVVRHGNYNYWKDKTVHDLF